MDVGSANVHVLWPRFLEILGKTILDDCIVGAEMVENRGARRTRGNDGASAAHYEDGASVAGTKGGRPNKNGEAQCQG